MTEATITVRELRRRWKPHKQRLQALRADHPTNVRIHRACSWLQRAEELAGDDADAALICRWIAFNSLYGQWDPQRREPMEDRASWRAFMDRILNLDAAGEIGALLEAQRPLVKDLLGDEYVARFFWEEPGDARARKAKKPMYDARTWYIQQQWPLLVERVLERVYLMRCQLVHGAATWSSQLNRQSLARCSRMLGHLLPAVLIVMIEHGADEEWGELCYPPLS